MNLKLETEFSKAPILQEVDALKKQIDDMRPLPEDVEGKVMQKLRLDWNYNSNAIEGNQLSYGETVAFLMEGITAKGKPLKDHLDIRGHNQAINFLLSIVKETRPLSESDIRALHEMVLVEPYEVKAQTADGAPTSKRISLGEYKTSPNHVQTATGETHYYATPEETPAKMRELTEWYSQVIDNPEIHPVVTAALFHHKFVAIHPFDDGNGRLSRILMNLILMQKGYPSVVIKMDDRRNYYALLSRADNGDGWPFIEYISERLTNSLQLFIKAIQGFDIDEDEDIEKEIALFKLELIAETNIKEKKSRDNLNKILHGVYIPLILRVLVKGKEFEEFFFNIQKSLKFINNDVFGDETELEENLDSFISLNVEAPLCDKVIFSYAFQEFKKHDHEFSITLNQTIEFNEYFCIFKDFNDVEFARVNYEDNSVNQDKQKYLTSSFVKAISKDIKTQFEKK